MSVCTITNCTSFFLITHGAFNISYPRTRVSTNLVNMTLLAMSLPVAQCSEHPIGPKRGHGFNSHWVLSFFLCPTLVTNYFLLRPFQGGFRCRQSEFQNPSFHVLRRKPCPCRYFTIVFVLVFVTVAVSICLYVVCCHFICLMSLFQGHVTCWNLP